MQTLWMGVRPGPALTRLRVQDGPIPILKARLPEAPQHPRALETLAEGLTPPPGADEEAPDGSAR
jgi:hypothetical protein